jgi:signal transduction histidine kinase
MGYASLLQMKMDKDNPLYGNASQILVSSEKAAISPRASLPLEEAGHQLKPVVINDTVDKLTSSSRGSYGGRGVQDTEDVERLVVKADPGQLDRCDMNLVTTPATRCPWREATITVDRATVSSEFISTHGYGKPGEYALMRISDTGTAWTQGDEKIFAPFFTTKCVGRAQASGSPSYTPHKAHNC